MQGDVGDRVEADGERAPEAGAAPPWVGWAVWRGIWQLIAAVLITLAALWFLRQARDLVRFLVLSQLLAFALEPGVSWLHDRRGWRRGSATGLLLAAILLLFLLIGVGMGSVLVRELDDVVRQVPA